MHGDINGIVISLGTIESIIKLKVINKTGKRVTKYLLLTGTEFEVRTTSYRTYSMERNRVRGPYYKLQNLQYGPRRRG